MNKNSSDIFTVLRSISKNPDASQRNLAKKIGFSLGKLNYCLKALKQKGLVKVENFKNNKDKQNYLYILTPKGISEKARLTVNFMNLKMEEYDELKKDLTKDVDNSKN
jgi:EPS-associated MarR family transcriptional regulator